jgi:hypothetical protein
MNHQGEVDALMGRLGEVGRVRLNAGPDHPTSPRPELAEPVDAYLAAHPYMARDPGYVAFLRRYAGAQVTGPERWFSLTLLGIGVDPESDLSTPSLVPDDHFECFADIHFKLAPEVPGPEPLAFAFARDGRPGVFMAEGYHEGPPSYRPLGGSFVEWLRRAIETRGRLHGVASLNAPSG